LVSLIKNVLNKHFFEIGDLTIAQIGRSDTNIPSIEDENYEPMYFTHTLRKLSNIVISKPFYKHLPSRLARLLLRKMKLVILEQQLSGKEGTLINRL
jgi:hypothetical protein